METFNPGYCTIESAIIANASGESETITGLIGRFDIQQSLAASTFSGSLDILDGIGLLSSLPIRGEESLKIKLKSHDLQTELSLDLQVIEISNVSIQKESGDQYAYTLGFISKTSWGAVRESVITAFRNKPASYCAKTIFKDYFAKNLGSRKFNYETSHGDMRIIIPDYNPIQAMNFLCAKAFTNKSASSSYRFFETVYGYSWVTDEWLLENAQKNEIKKLKYSPVVDRNPTSGPTIIETLIEFETANHVNTLKDMNAGAYRNTVMEIDLTTHKKRTFDYDYLRKKKNYKGMQGQVGGISGMKHTESFIKKTFTEDNAPQYIVYRDWSPIGMEQKPGQVPRDDQHMTEVIQNRTAYNYHLRENMCSGEIRGRLDIHPGEVVNLSILEPDAALEGKQNKRLSGLYLIYRTAHNINGTDLVTSIDMVKFDWETAV